MIATIVVVLLLVLAVAGIAPGMYVVITDSPDGEDL